MKILIHSILFSFTIIFIGCEEVSKDPINIKIETGKNEYVVNTVIDVTLTNNSNKQAQHFKCDNSDLGPFKMLKYENGIWIENYYAILCTAMGPMGYFGVLDISETKHDTLSLYNETGKFKLRYRFIVDNDTLDFDSNEFLLYGIEL